MGKNSLKGDPKAVGGLRISFDKDRDVFGVIVKSGKADAIEVADDLLVELIDREIAGVEILDASKWLGKYWEKPEESARRALELARMFVRGS